MRIIDLDSHIGPNDQWDYLPDEFRNMRPIQVFDRLGRTVLVNPPRAHGDARPNRRESATFELKKAATNGYFDPEVRLKYMDKLGVELQMLNPRLSPICYEIEPKLGAALCRSTNQSIGNILKKHPDRFLGAAILPTQDIGASLDEAQRCMENGFHTLFLKTNQGGKNFEDYDFWPIYDYAEKNDIPIILHPTNLDKGSAIQPGRLKSPWSQTAGFLSEYLVAMCSLIFGGVLDAYPKLRFCLQEGGATWIPWFLDRLSNTYDSDEKARTTAKHPTEYLDSNFYFTIEPSERALGYLCEHVSSKNLMLGSDYPHPDITGRFDPNGELSNTIKLLMVREDLSLEAKEDISYKNALRFLGGKLKN